MLFSSLDGECLANICNLSEKMIKIHNLSQKEGSVTTEDEVLKIS